MDGTKLILTEPVSPPTMLEHLDQSRLKSISDEKKKQVAKDFESVLLNKLLDEMKNSIVDWGLEKDAASKQTEKLRKSESRISVEKHCVFLVARP